jgi:hypothetical protein
MLGPIHCVVLAKPHLPLGLSLATLVISAIVHVVILLIGLISHGAVNAARNCPATLGLDGDNHTFSLATRAN